MPSQVRTSPAFKSAVASRAIVRAEANPASLNMSDTSSRVGSTGSNHWKAPQHQAPNSANAPIASDAEALLFFDSEKFDRVKSWMVERIGTSPDIPIIITPERITTWKDLAAVGRKLSVYKWIRRRWLLKRYSKRMLDRWSSRHNYDARKHARNTYVATQMVR